MSNPRLPQVAAILTALALLATATAAQSPARSTRGKAAAKSIGAQPLTFEEHRAPGATRRTFVSRGAGYTLSLTPAAAELTLPRTDLALRMTLQGANRSAPMHGLEPQAPIYHVTQASRGALTGTPTYGRVHYSSVYRGIDLVYYGNDRQLEFDFLVAPHADPKKIRFSIDGADALSLTPDGELSLRSRDHEFRLRKPLIYQNRGGKRQEIHGGYRVLDAKRRIIGFELGRYDRSQPLVIDPTIVFATYLGGADEDYPNTLAVDAIGNIYLFADTRDPSTLPSDLVVQPEPLAPPQAGFGQCLLTKLNPDGANAEYSILFEGAQCQAMALDRSTLSSERRIHVAVGTSFHYQRTITESPYTGLTIGLLNGAYDACQLGSCGPTEWMGTDSSGNVYFVMNLGAPHELRKIDAAGSPLGALVLLDPPLHPLPDGSRAIYDQIRAFDVDESGVFYAAAVVTEPGLITPTADALQPTRPSASCTDPSLSACWDGAILVVDTNAPGNFQFRYASYLGGRDYDYVAAIAHDPDQPGVVYVTGNSASSDFPTTPGSYNTQAPFNGGAGVTFVTKLDLAAGNPPAFQRKFSTFIGSAYSYPQALTPLPGGAGVAVVGVASDDPCPPFTCFPLVNSLYPKRSQQEMRPYVAALSADGAALSFSSYLDSTLHTDGFAFDVANNGSQLLYVAMTTNDPSLGTSGTLQPSNRGQHDVLVQAIDVSTILAPNDAPEIVFTPSVIQTTAIDLNGALVPIICGKLFACSITDADGDQIEHLAWLGPNNFRVAATGLPASGSADIVPQAYLALPVGTHTLTLRARDTAGRIGSASLTVNVSGVNTFPGQAQTVTLTDPKFVVFGAAGQGSEHPIDVTFDAVTQAGLTYLESLPGAVPPPPVGWQAGSPPYVYDLKSTAAFAPGVQVCFNTRGMSFARPQGDLQIFQLVNGAWTPLPGQTQPDPFRICGHTVTLGRFVILYPEVPATRITTYAGTGCAENSRDGAGGDPCDDFAAVAEATQSSLTRPGRIAVDPAGAIYVADNGGSPAPQTVAEPLDDLAEIYAALVLGTRDYVRKNGFRSVILGLSGGIDSALVATIASDALGPENVHAVLLPSRYSSEGSVTDAEDLVKRQGIGSRIVPIAGMVEAFEAELDLHGLAAENLQARIRANVWMGLSNEHGHLVLTGGNKSELATGYSTLYGDSAGGFGPIKDVFKTTVWDLARWRNAQAGVDLPFLHPFAQEPIPQVIIDKEPSAELRPGQRDSDSLPDYSVLDPLLADYVEHDMGRDALLAAGHDPALVDRVIRLVDLAEYKRRQYPPGPKITPKNFGRDRRLPITTRWRESSAR